MIDILDFYLRMFKVNTIDTENKCLCSGKHVPDPRFLCTIDTAAGPVLLCPTAASNLAGLLAEYRNADGRPLGSITKHYGKFIRDLADIIYMEAKMA
jgi:hypothetical protein